MTKFQKKLVVTSVIIIAFICLLGWIGDYDYCEQVILYMTQEEYDSVKNHLTIQNGYAPSDKDIAHWWAEHHRDN